MVRVSRVEKVYTWISIKLLQFKSPTWPHLLPPLPNGMHLLEGTCMPASPIHPPHHTHTLREALLAMSRPIKAECLSTQAGPAIPPGTEPDLGMRIILAHGDEVIGDSADAGLTAACDKFKRWVAQAFPPEK